MKVETTWKSKIGVADVNQVLEMLDQSLLTVFRTLYTPSNSKTMISSFTTKSGSIGCILPRKTVYHDISKDISRDIMIYHSKIMLYHPYIIESFFIESYINICKYSLYHTGISFIYQWYMDICNHIFICIHHKNISRHQLQWYIMEGY